MKDYDFIVFYQLLQRYESEIEQDYINHQNNLYGRIRDLDNFAFLDLIEINAQRDLFKRIRHDILLIAQDLLETLN